MSKLLNSEETCEIVKGIFEAVVTASLPGEERIFWPYKDVQFYIIIGKQKIHSTSNRGMKYV